MYREEIEEAKLPYFFPKILNIFVPQTGQMPFIARRSPPLPGIVTS